MPNCSNGQSLFGLLVVVVLGFEEEEANVVCVFCVCTGGEEESWRLRLEEGPASREAGGRPLNLTPENLGDEFTERLPPAALEMEGFSEEVV